MPATTRHATANLPAYFLGRPAARYVERYGRRRPLSPAMKPTG